MKKTCLYQLIIILSFLFLSNIVYANPINIQSQYLRVWGSVNDDATLYEVSESEDVIPPGIPVGSSSFYDSYDSGGTSDQSGSVISPYGYVDASSAASLSSDSNRVTMRTSAEATAAAILNHIDDYHFWMSDAMLALAYASLEVTFMPLSHTLFFDSMFDATQQTGGSATLYDITSDIAYNVWDINEFHPNLTHQYKLVMDSFAGTYDNITWARNNVTITGTPVPEPATMLLLGLGLIGLAGVRRKFKK